MKITVYIPDDLARDLEEAERQGQRPNVSAICQSALRSALVASSDTALRPARCRCGHWDNLHLEDGCLGMGKSWDVNCLCKRHHTD